jgi:hypothetical protein
MGFTAPAELALARQADLLVQFEQAGVEGFLVGGPLRREGLLGGGAVRCALLQKGRLLRTQQCFQRRWIVRERVRQDAGNRLGKDGNSGT